MYVIYCKNKPISEFIVAEHLDTYFEELRVKLGYYLRLRSLSTQITNECFRS